MDNVLLIGLAVAVLVWHVASTSRHQPQIMRIAIVPDESQIEAGGCLLPVIVLLGLLLWFLLSGGK